MTQEEGGVLVLFVRLRNEPKRKCIHIKIKRTRMMPFAQVAMLGETCTSRERKSKSKTKIRSVDVDGTGKKPLARLHGVWGDPLGEDAASQRARLI
jgi:hypothetical protein